MILVNPHPSKEWLVNRAKQRLKEEFERLQVTINKALINIRRRVKEAIENNQFLSMKGIIEKINPILAGWVNYYRVGHSSNAFSNVRDYVKKRIRRLLEKRTRKKGRGFGWSKWNSQFIYGVLGLYWDYKIQHLQPLGEKGN